MVIKYIKANGNIFEDNKTRISDVKKAMKTLEFNDLKELITGNKRELLKEYLENEVFFEFLSQDIVHKVIGIFNRTAAKEQMLIDLENAYRTRGAKGMFLCWHSTLNKYESN